MKIYSKGTDVVIEVPARYPLSSSYVFYWNCNRADFAQLLAENLRENFTSQIQRIRREEYDNGWKDAKAKKAKRTFFSGLFK